MVRISCLSAVFCMAACSASSTTAFEADDAGPDMNSLARVPDGGGDGASPGPSGTLSGDAGGVPAVTDAGPGKTLLYAHTDKTLYRIDPTALNSAMTPIGDFDCLGGDGGSSAMTDVAVSKDGKIYGVSEVAAYPLTVQPGAVHCDATWPMPSNAKFYGLTFAPENTVAVHEALIAANGAGELFEIDAGSGHTTQVGTLGVDAHGQAYALSGDIVFLANGTAPVGFATVRTCTPATHGAPSCSATDTLIEVDVKAIKPGTQSVLKAVRGPVTKGKWCTNAASPKTFGSMFGIAAFEDKIFGFSRHGDFVEIHNDDGSACLIAADASKKFAGAGVTTIAPVVAPPPPPPVN